MSISNRMRQVLRANFRSLFSINAKTSRYIQKSRSLKKLTGLSQYRFVKFNSNLLSFAFSWLKIPFCFLFFGHFSCRLGRREQCDKRRLWRRCQEGFYSPLVLLPARTSSSTNFARSNSFASQQSVSHNRALAKNLVAIR